MPSFVYADQHIDIKISHGSNDQVIKLCQMLQKNYD